MGSGAEMVNKAEAYRETRVREAEGEAQRFLSVLAEYEKAEDVVRTGSFAGHILGLNP